MNIEIDNLIDLFNHNTTVLWKPNINFIKDINIIIEELKLYKTYIDLDIYEVLVSCGHDLTWNQEYFISFDDLNWFESDEGKKYFLMNFDNFNNILHSISEYNSLLKIHSNLLELFKLGNGY